MELDRFDTAKEPFWKDHIGQTFIHEDDGEIDARVTVFVPNTRTTVGRFACFDCIHDEEVAESILSEATQWLVARGVSHVEGPYFFNIHEEVGLLTRGFESPSAIMMPYNPGYYHELLEHAGFDTVRRFLTYRYDLESCYETVHSQARAIGNYTIRSFDMKQVGPEIAMLLDVYNSAFQDNWGFEPITASQGEQLIQNILEVGDPRLVRVAERDGQAVGFILCVPDVNGHLYSIRNYPELMKKLSLGWNVMRHNIRDCRVITLAVRREFQGKALSRLLVDSLASVAREAGYRNAELSYVDTENRQMKRLMVGYRFHTQKEYRIFAKELG